MNHRYNSAADEILSYGSILIATEDQHDIGDVLPGSANVNESGAPDLRVVADGFRKGAGEWLERKGTDSWNRLLNRPEMRFFYYALPIDGTGNAGQAAEAIADQSIGIQQPQSATTDRVIEAETPSLSCHGE
jgi:hypothetical protein